MSALLYFGFAFLAAGCAIAFSQIDSAHATTRYWFMFLLLILAINLVSAVMDKVR